jgi:nitrite reductase (NADH) large subunit
VAIEFITRYTERGDAGRLKVFGKEPVAPYDRVQLSALLAGQVTFKSVTELLPEALAANLDIELNNPIEHIDTTARAVVDSSGCHHAYDRLVLALGSRPRLLNIDGITLNGVFTFRHLWDAQQLSARLARSRHVVVIGGGLLGLETAYAMRRRGTRVSVVEQAPHLMAGQLDAAAAARLQAELAGDDLHFYIGSGIRSIGGTCKVEHVMLRDGTRLECDTVVLSAGIVPNIELARDSRIAVGRGIKVNDTLTTSDPRVYAIGECAEHRGRVSGVVVPGLAQARILADRLLGGTALYVGSVVPAQLKVVDSQVFSMGDIDETGDSSLTTFTYEEDHVYRKIVLRHGRLVGAVAYGVLDERATIQQWISERKRLWFPKLIAFRRTGLLTPGIDANDIRTWPDPAIVCNCAQVSKADLCRAFEGGCTSVDTLARATKASTVCGSCRPLLQQMTAQPLVRLPVKRTLAVLSGLALISSAAFTAAPAVAPSDTAQQAFTWDQLWTDALWKQVSGYSLVALTAIALLLSFRKRLRGFGLFSFDAWRYLHITIGLASIAILVVHTGASFGDYLNRALSINFVLLLAIGAAAGIVVGIESRLTLRAARRLRKSWTWAHILAFWPLPTLLGFHILSVYYF